MAKFTTSDQIYDSLVENSEESWILGVVAFAIIEERRIEWIKHHEANNGEPPTPEEITKWYEQLTERELVRTKDTAETELVKYSNEVVSGLSEKEIQKIQNDVIVTEVRDLKRFWPQFGVNLAGGLVSALVFAVLLATIGFVLKYETSPTEIASELQGKLEADK